MKEGRHDILLERVPSDQLPLSMVDFHWWPAAARTGLAPLTLASLNEYLAMHDNLEAWARQFMEHDLHLAPIDDDPEPAALEHVHMAILQLEGITTERKVEPLSQARARLAVDTLEHPMRELIPSLVAKNILPESKEAYQAAQESSPEVLAQLAAHSPEASTYLRRIPLSTSELQALTSHADLHGCLLELDADTLSVVSTPSARTLLEAVRDGEGIPTPAVLATLAHSADDVNLAAQALSTVGENYDDSAIRTVLGNAGEPLSLLGRKVIESDAALEPLVMFLKRRGIVSKTRKVNSRESVKSWPPD